MKKIAILQSNYIPWKGYFDMIASVDEVIIYDDVQYTKNDWRNRNKIKTPMGLEWITVPTGQDIKRSIRDVEILDPFWQKKHWKTLIYNYRKSLNFDEITTFLEPLYHQPYTHLTVLNRHFIESICKYLGIKTKITNSWDYTSHGDKTERLVELCIQAGGIEYVTGPSACNYIQPQVFADRGIKLSWFNYDGYPEYPQLWGPFIHEVTILDLLFNCGKASVNFMRYVKS